MNRRWALAVLVSLLVGMCGVGVVAAGPRVDAATGRYPGSMRNAVDQFDLTAFTKGVVTRQATFSTDDALLTVRNWYAARLHLAPSTSVLAASGGCVMLTQADLIYRFEHTLALVICPLEHGTQIVVNEKVALLH